MWDGIQTSSCIAWRSKLIIISLSKVSLSLDSTTHWASVISWHCGILMTESKMGFFHLMCRSSLPSIVVRRWSQIVWEILRLYVIHGCTDASSSIHWRLSTTSKVLVVIVLKIFIIIMPMTFLAHASTSWHAKLHLSSSHCSWSSVLWAPHSSTRWWISVTKLRLTCTLQMWTSIFPFFSELFCSLQLFFLFRRPIADSLGSLRISWVGWISQVRALSLAWSVT